MNTLKTVCIFIAGVAGFMLFWRWTGAGEQKILDGQA